MTIKELQESPEVLLQRLDFDIQYARERISELQHELNELYEERYNIEQQLIAQGNPPDLAF